MEIGFTDFGGITGVEPIHYETPNQPKVLILGLFRQPLRNIKQFGLFKRSNDFANNAKLRIGIVNALNSTSPDNFLSELSRELND